ncbi:ion channel [Aurantibacter aestuarii]|uniref:Ion transporter n=1 Tax=Aurantibacter aestuarii TaxID=1266046 RepID=A0A2T1N977_9FLAO|nr:ion channel [Aurantibacter aestuarii]PSG88437.1 ion transporter [Aurantibacter aestuarii]
MGKVVKDPGFGNNSTSFAGRMINNDGTFNIKRVGTKTSILQTYHYLIQIKWTWFFVLAFSMFIAINLVFAAIYLLIGVESISVAPSSFFRNLANAFFFSVQTFTSLGYGAFAPNTISSGFVSSLEAFVGLAMFAFLTGLIYGRFSKPTPNIRFSKNIVLREFNHTKAIMFRVVNNRASVMIKPKVTVTLALTRLDNNAHFKREFFALNLERDEISYLPTTWTIVHEINAESPLSKFSSKELLDQDGELLVLMTYYDESFNQELHQMYSYQLEELLLDHKFTQAYYYDDDGKMVLDFNLFDEVENLNVK